MRECRAEISNFEANSFKMLKHKNLFRIVFTAEFRIEAYLMIFCTWFNQVYVLRTDIKLNWANFKSFRAKYQKVWRQIFFDRNMNTYWTCLFTQMIQVNDLRK